VVFSDIDRRLLARCLDREPKAWEAFVDRFMGLVVHVVNHTSQARSIRLSPQDREDLCAEVFLAIVKDDFSVLRRFRGQSSLATYLTVVARRVVVRRLMKSRSMARLADAPSGSNHPAEDRVDNREEVEQLISRLDRDEAEVVRLYHLEGKSYREISDRVGMPENSVGPLLSRARQKMRRTTADK